MQKTCKQESAVNMDAKHQFQSTLRRHKKTCTIMCIRTDVYELAIGVDEVNSGMFAFN